MTASRFAAALMLAAGLLSVPAAAQPPGPPARWRQPGEPPSPIDQLERLRLMSPEQRERFLDRLPPQRRANVERHLQNYIDMTDAQRARLREQYEVFRQLPPEKQQVFRNLFGRFMNQPPARQELMREEFQRLREMSPLERQKRLDSYEFHYRFQPNEREILGRLAMLLP
jgi:hypothetical protein